MVIVLWVWDINVFLKCHNNPSSSCSEILVKTTNVRLIVALEKLKDHQSD